MAPVNKNNNPFANDDRNRSDQDRNKSFTPGQEEENNKKKPQGKDIHQQREEFDKEHDLSSLSDEERRRMHEAYAQMGSVGGSKRAEELGREGYEEMGHMGGVSRAEQMAKTGKFKKEER